MAQPTGLWQHRMMTSLLETRRNWIFCATALAIWLALGWPVIRTFTGGPPLPTSPVSPWWFAAYLVMGAAIFGAMGLKLPTRTRWALLVVQVGAVMAMAHIISWAGMAQFLIIVAWQAAIATTLGKALGWVTVQTLAVTAALATAINPDICWVILKSAAMQTLLVLAGTAMRREMQAARALAISNRELHAAQAIIATRVRDAERLRISRELHDAWGHELTALGLQLEIASNVSEPDKAKDHVLQARALSKNLLGKVRDVVATLRDAERCDLDDALATLARSVPSPAIHVSVAPGVRVDPDRAHALLRCAQEAVTNAVRHAEASNLWLQVTGDGDGVRLVARDDGTSKPAETPPGSGLVGMRERVEDLGGKLAVRTGAGFGFTIDAWLPSVSPQPA